MNHYGLDMAWYVRAPGLYWDAALKNKEGSTCFLSDSDILLMIRIGIRGGIATILHRHANANNEYLGTELDEFDPAKESKCISQLGAHSLNGWAMSKQLQTPGFKWITDYERYD